jgi:serine/threonine protein kinase
MPIPEDFRFWCTSGSSRIETSEWTFADVDQRRMVTLRMDGDLDVEEHEDVALEHFKRHIDSLSHDVVWIHVDFDGGLISVSSDPVDDPNVDMYYPPLDLIQRRAGVQAILRSELRELDRLMASVDLVSYRTEAEPEATRKAVFKYYWQHQFVEKQWDEMNLWMRLSHHHHPNIVPLDRLVLDEVRGGVVGFTTLYIPGGNLEDNVSRTFKLKWCGQLMQVVDDLNLRYGIAHQDIVPRNLLVDEATDNIMLFDFNTAAQIGRNRGRPFFWYWYVNSELFPPSPFRKDGG